MPIKQRSAEEIALFLFAHQDDEFGAFQAITEERKKGRRVICCYFTDGGFGDVSVQRRNDESLAVLAQLGVHRTQVNFVGEILSISDAKLSENLKRAADWLSEFIEENPGISAVYLPAWEGGHHDHDALHAIGVVVLNDHGLLNKAWQFSLYNKFRRKGPLFRVFYPLAENGPVERVRISWLNRMKYLRFCTSYPSQAKTWLGLFPFVLSHYVFNGCQETQRVSLRRLEERPHEGVLYYEQRNFSTWDKLSGLIRQWRDSSSGRVD